MARGSFGHLVMRGIRSFAPARPLDETESAAVAAALTPGLFRLFQAMAPRDQRHSAAVWRHVQRSCPAAPGEVAAAALVHDVGKAICPAGLVVRVWATAVEAVGGGGHVRPEGRVGRYLRYPEFGAAAVKETGEDPTGLIAAWCREHHLGEDEWTIPVEWGWVLRDADDRAA